MKLTGLVRASYLRDCFENLALGCEIDSETVRGCVLGADQ